MTTTNRAVQPPLDNNDTCRDPGMSTEPPVIPNACPHDRLARAHCPDCQIDGAAVRRHRTRLGISQEQLESEAGCSAGYLSKIENHGVGSYHTAVGIAHALGVPLSWIIK